MPLVPVDDLNAATPVAELTDRPIAVGSFYIRSNFEVPIVDPAQWALEVKGSVARPFTIGLPELQEFEVVRERITVECAGNFRTLMDPVPSGTPWGIGAASSADFMGVRLADVLARALPTAEVAEWVFTGADRGSVDGSNEISYAFPLEIDVAHGPEPLLVWEMNDRPLPRQHGGPVRLVVPGHYGMRSVKWVISADAVESPFEGHFRRKYRYYGSRIETEGAPVDRIRVRSVITDPQEGAVPPGPITVSGVAWSGHGPVSTVHVSVDDAEWIEANLEGAIGPFGMSRWNADVDLAPGPHTIRARATDQSGNQQPLEAPWNRNGYGNNVVHTVSVVA
jgi:DMSO/TMAO reductase YedYZ molybdopterin-dependent catalytic subunit